MKVLVTVQDLPAGKQGLLRLENPYDGEKQVEDQILANGQSVEVEVTDSTDLRLFTEDEPGHADQDQYLRTGA